MEETPLTATPAVQTSEVSTKWLRFQTRIGDFGRKLYASLERPLPNELSGDP